MAYRKYLFLLTLSGIVFFSHSIVFAQMDPEKNPEPSLNYKFYFGSGATGE